MPEACPSKVGGVGPGKRVRPLARSKVNTKRPNARTAVKNAATARGLVSTAVDKPLTASCSEAPSKGEPQTAPEQYAGKAAPRKGDTKSLREDVKRKEETTESSGQVDGVSLFAAPAVSTRSRQNIQHAVLPVFINGAKTIACLDTGAGKNYIAEARLSDLEKAAIENTPLEGPVRHAGGGKMKLLGKLSTSLEIGGRNFGLVPFIVARRLPVDAILGNEFITRNVAALYPRTQWIRFNGATAMTKYQVKSTSIENPLVRQPVQVRSLERRRLRAESVTPIRVELDRALSVPCMIRRNTRAFAVHGLLPAQVILPPGVKDTILLIGNFDKRSIDIFPRQRVAECEIEEMDQCKILGVLPEEAKAVAPTAQNPPRTSSSTDEKAHEREVMQKIKDQTMHLEANQQKKLLQMLEEFASTVLGPRLGRTSILQHEIKLNDKGPVVRPQYRLGPQQEEFARTESVRMLEEGLVRESRSPFSAPIIIAQKPRGGLRYCTNFRALNEITEKDAYPLPKSDVLLDRLGGCSYFTTMDAERGFFQVEVREADRHKTAFSTPIGLLEYNVMPMGLTNSPPCFQRLMDIVLRGLHKHAVCFIDDVIVFSKGFDDHVRDLKAVFKRLEAAGMTLNLTKCRFAVNTVEFLGHFVSPDGIRPSLRKTEAVEKLAPPRDVTGVRQFLALTGWFRRFIKDYARRTRNLANLTREGQAYIWTAKHQAEFEDMKRTLCQRPVLRLPDYDQPFTLDVDASKGQIGGILMQPETVGPKQKLKPVAYLSRALHGAELNYTVTEKEALAAVWCLKKVRHLVGSQEVTIVTDHAALRYLMTSTRDPYGRLARWSLALQDFNVVFVTRAGKKHLAGDAMSRLSRESEEKVDDMTAEEETDVNEEVIFTIMEAVEREIEWGYGLPDLEEFRTEQRKDKTLKQVLQYLRTGRMPKDEDLRRFLQRREHEFVVSDGLLKRAIKQGTRSWR